MQFATISSIPTCITKILHMSGGQYLAMDMAKVGGPLSVVKVCTSMLCVKIGYRYVAGSVSVVTVFTQI